MITDWSSFPNITEYCCNDLLPFGQFVLTFSDTSNQEENYDLVLLGTGKHILVTFAILQALMLIKYASVIADVVEVQHPVYALLFQVSISTGRVKNIMAPIKCRMGQQRTHKSKQNLF